MTAATEWKNPLKGWYNKPDKKVVFKDNKIVIKVPIGTDCWLKTKQGLLQQGRTINNAPFHWQKVEATHFTAVVKITGSASTTMTTDGAKAGLMIRVDEEHYIFTGLEYLDQKVYHGTSVAIGRSDYSIAPLPEKAERAGVMVRIIRHADLYECAHSLDDGLKWSVTRIGRFTNEPLLYVGVSCACPGSDDFRATFESYECQVGTAELATNDIIEEEYNVDNGRPSDIV
jgi:uncharacterized protein